MRAAMRYFGAKNLTPDERAKAERRVSHFENWNNKL
jgi:hypothetical protein